MTPQSLIDALLAPGALRTALQPIVALGDGEPPRAVMYECLTRGPAGSNLEHAPVLFDYVRLKHDEPAIDRACVANALRTVRCDPGAALSLNVHAATLARDPSFARFLLHAADDAGIDASRLIVELVEHSPAWNSDVVRALADLRDAGVRIALDDIGLGQSNFRMILDLRPEIFKIDRYFVAGCHSDPHRLAVIASICELARAFGATIVAEGIEDSRDIAPLAGRGITLFQGYLFGLPVLA